MSARAEGAELPRPRAYRMVERIEKELGDKELRARLPEARIMALPALLQRNGLLQVSVFLKAKGSSDERLRQLLQGAIREVVGAFKNSAEEEFALDARYLAKLDMSRALLLEELALEAATWIRRLYDASGAAS